MLTRATIDRVVAAALEEDAPWGDITAETLIPADARARAQLVARVAGVFSEAPSVPPHPSNGRGASHDEDARRGQEGG